MRSDSLSPPAAAPDTFDKFVNGGQFALVEFYA
jgi:hypothetical protein